MSSELIIRATQEDSQIALLEEKQLVEFHEERQTDKFNVGDIYLGKVRRVVAGLNAAFVDIGHSKDAFLHYLDLGTQFPSLCAYTEEIRKNNYRSLSDFAFTKGIEKEGKIADVVSKGDLLLLQIEKVPIAQKGARISCQLSLAGRYLILFPFNSGIFISRRITQAEERERLTRLVDTICPKNFGIVVRTAAEGVSAAEFHKDLKARTDAWELILQRLRNAKERTRIIGEERRSTLLLRDMLSDTLESIYVDKETLYEEIRQYVLSISPKKGHIVHLYEGKQSIFEHFNVERQLRSAFGRRIRLPGGGSLVIDHTEALHAVDVNSGKKCQRREPGIQRAAR